MDLDSAMWSDGFIVNLGKSEWEGRHISLKELDNRYVDGDFLIYYLDSPEQALLVIPIFTEIVEGGGDTMISPDGIQIIGRNFMEHPEGMSPRMVL